MDAYGSALVGLGQKTGRGGEGRGQAGGSLHDGCQVVLGHGTLALEGNVSQ